MSNQEIQRELTPREFDLQASRREVDKLSRVTDIRSIETEKGRSVIIEHLGIRVSPMHMLPCTGSEVIHSDFQSSMYGVVLVVTCRCCMKFKVPRNYLTEEICEILKLDRMPDV